LISLDTFLASSAHSNCGIHRLPSLLGVNEVTDLPVSSPYRLGRQSNKALELPCRVMPLLSPGISWRTRPTNAGHPPFAFSGRHLAVQTISGGSGISTGCPSPTTFVLGLGPTNPERTSLPQETLGLRRVGFSPTSRYSCRHSHFRPLQPSSRSTFTANRTLPYHRPPGEPGCQSVASVPSLSPVTFSARNHLTSELLRTLSMMAASEPTSWLSVRFHILCHLAWI
jgi:hypothetical protein